MRRSLFWRVFAVNAGLLGGIAVLLLVSPIEIDSPIRTTQALIVVAGLAITLAANAILLRRAFMPLERLVRRMETVDLLRPGQRLRVQSVDEVGRVVSAFNHMLDRLDASARAQRRFVADASHELRSPLTGLCGPKSNSIHFLSIRFLPPNPIYQKPPRSRDNGIQGIAEFFEIYVFYEFATTNGHEMARKNHEKDRASFAVFS